jgi:ferritin
LDDNQRPDVDGFTGFYHFFKARMNETATFYTLHLFHSKNTDMLNKKVEKALNDQIKVEAESSQAYLAMACWAEINGYPGTSAFLYAHSDEERMHMMKLIRFVNDRGGKAIIAAISEPAKEFKNLQNIFALLLSHENKVTAAINNVVDVCLKEKDLNEVLDHY